MNPISIECLVINGKRYQLVTSATRATHLSYLVDINNFRLKPNQELPLGLPGLVGPRACPGFRLQAGGGNLSLRGLLQGFGSSGGGALTKPAYQILPGANRVWCQCRVPRISTISEAFRKLP
ncbi:hypothetical protein L3X38_042011 [Prunus dulcis]|uniref:Uncharacterized protein n=1 Tax=Prunus dulcis TaxID=3755 RepID=A0AAD4UVR8_PRUDU|nr:hypothetical protein L3X38_042011 [Prunus dulcis]